MGASIKSGYNSHYVLTKRDGTINDNIEDKINICDEFVIGQEAHILPAFLITLDTDNCLEYFDEWNRETVKDNNSSDTIIDLSSSVCNISNNKEQKKEYYSNLQETI
jgi:hypothetical protein